ncbi:hypothetical protein [Mesorhizobium sp. A623]
MTMLEDMVRPLVLTGRLLVRFWPQLLLIGAVGFMAHDFLLDAAVGVGMQYPLGGMVVLSLVVLAKLLVVVTMFAALRPGLPALAALRQGATEASAQAPPPGNADTMLGVTAAVILPFFAYYAAWGFLGDTVREYSRLALERVPFGESLQIFDLLQSRGLIAAIIACWAIRWFAKRMNKYARAPWWRLLIVAADASWIFIGLYALGVWKDDFIAWLGAGSLLDKLDASALSLSMAVHASEGFVPVEFQPQGSFEQAKNLFFYALLPMVWLVMAAIINGYDLSAAARPKAASAGASTWQKWLHDFAAHFFGGYRTRYRPVWSCLKLTLGTGIATLLTCIVAYRALNWATAWLWYGATRMLGPYDLDTWQLIGSVSNIFIGNPSDLDGGILFDAVRIALLAAVLEYAVATRTLRGRQQRAAAT